MLEYGSKLIITVVSGSRPPVYGVRLRKYAAEAYNQAAAQGKLVGGLIRIDTGSVIVTIVEGSPRRSHRGKELGFQLNAHARRNIDICPNLKSCGKIATRCITGTSPRGHNVRSQQQAQEGPNCRIGDIPGKYRAGHDKILAQVTAVDLSASVVAVGIDTRARGDMIIKNFDPDVTVDIKIDRTAEVQTAGYSAVCTIKIISRRKSITNLRNQFHRGLRKGTACR